MWNQFQDFLPKAAGKYNFAETMKAIEICRHYRQFAAEILPKGALNNTFGKQYKDHTLTVGVLSSVWAEQVQMNKHRIHQSLQKKFGVGAVKNIKIAVVEKMPEAHAHDSSG